MTLLMLLLECQKIRDISLDTFTTAPEIIIKESYEGYLKLNFCYRFNVRKSLVIPGEFLWNELRTTLLSVWGRRSIAVIAAKNNSGYGAAWPI